MAYSTARRAIDLFGGDNPNSSVSYLGDTWELGFSCYPNSDGSTAPPILNINDFQ